MDGFLVGRLTDADTAWRATRALRREVVGEWIRWDKAHRRLWRVGLQRGRAGEVLAKSLVLASERAERESWREQVRLLARVNDGVEEAGALFQRRAAMAVEYALVRSQAALCLGERELLIEWARDGEGAEERRREREDLAAELDEAVQKLDRYETGEDFHRRKGALIPPVAGEPVHRFGPRKQEGSMSFVRHSGLTYEVEEGTEVRGVANGEVVFADRLAGYGRLVIVDHGGGYHSLYAHLREVRVSEGERIGAREVVGTSGQSGSLEGPKLYFELRQQGVPVDPVEWFVRHD